MISGSVLWLIASCWPSVFGPWKRCTAIPVSIQNSIVERCCRYVSALVAEQTREPQLSRMELSFVCFQVVLSDSVRYLSEEHKIEDH